MANSLGALVVRLGLDAAEFTSGMTKAEFQAKKFSQQMDQAVAAGIIKAEIALRAFGAAARIAGDAFQSLTTGAAEFADLADKTGASAESLASLSVSAATAGVSMEDVAGSVNKLAKNLVGVDDESQAAGAALKALNINVAEFKKLNPTEQYQAVGKALEGFADGASKVAVAQALFGKSGAEQLRVFKALQENGGAQVILTEKQIQQADAYADRQAKATQQLKLYAQAAATEALPALTDLSKAAIDVAKAMLGVDEATGGLKASNAVKEFADSAVDSLAFAVDALDGFGRVATITAKTIGATFALAGALARGSLVEAKSVGESFSADMDRILQRVQLSERIAKARAARAADDADRRREDRGFTPPGRKLDFEGAMKLGSAKAAKSFSDYATEVSQAVAKLVEDADLVRIAKLNDQLKELDKLAAAGLSPSLVSDARAAIFAKLPKDIEAASIAFRQLEIAGTEAVNKAFDADKIEAFLKKQERLDDLLGRNVLKRQREDVQLLTEAFEAGEVSIERYTELVAKAAGVLDDGAKATKSFGEEFGNTFTSVLEDAIVKFEDLRSILKGLEQDLLRIAARKLITEPLQKVAGGFLDGILGSASGDIGSILSGIFGGGRASGGPVDAGMLYRVNERRPEMLDVGGRQFLMMGSQGGRVDPNPRIGRSQTVNNYFTLHGGAADLRTQNQLAAAAARGVASANARLN